MAATVNSKLLQTGVLATTLVNSGRQCDAPNGWGPLEWIAVIGLRNYGNASLAQEIASGWAAANMQSNRFRLDQWCAAGTGIPVSGS